MRGEEAGERGFELDEEAEDLEVWEGRGFKEGEVRPAIWEVVDFAVGRGVDEEVVILVKPVGELGVLGAFLAAELTEGFGT